MYTNIIKLIKQIKKFFGEQYTIYFLAISENEISQMVIEFSNNYNFIKIFLGILITLKVGLDIILMILKGIISFKKKYKQILKISKEKKINKTWICNKDLLRISRFNKSSLKISRKNGTLSYNKVDGEIYYKVCDIVNHSKKN